MIVGQKLGYVDGLRAVAILSVIATHTSGRVERLPFPWDSWLGNAAMGVQLFFVASAFTLAMSWDRRNDGALAFYVRRIFRIAPLFWIGISFYSWLYHEYSVVQIVTGATFTAEFNPSLVDSPPPGGISVQTEMLFYLLFPIIASKIIRGPAGAAIFYLVTLFASRLLNPIIQEALSPYFGPDDLGNYIFLWLGTQLPVFGMGFLAYHLSKRFPWRHGGWQLNLLVIGAIVWIAWFSLHSATSLVVVGFGVAVYALANGAAEHLFIPFVRHVGVVSFGMYLWHFFVLDALSRVRLPPMAPPVHFLVLYLLVFACTFVIAEATHRIVESPMIAFGHRLARSVSKTATSHLMTS